MKTSNIPLALLCGILAVLIVAGIAMERRDFETQDCRGMEIEVNGEYAFVDRHDVGDFVMSRYADPAGMKACEVDLWQIENLLDSHSAVLKSEVWMESDNTVHVSLVQRTPVIRLQKGNEGFYVDSTGCIFPLQKNFSARVPVLDGEIPVKIEAGYKGLAETPEEREWIALVLEMVKVMKDGVWMENISQIRVDDKRNLTLIPRTGNEKIHFGGADDAARKFASLGKYYTHIKPSKEPGYYKSVDVSNKGKIICRK